MGVVSSDLEERLKNLQEEHKKVLEQVIESHNLKLTEMQEQLDTMQVKHQEEKESLTQQLHQQEKDGKFLEQRMQTDNELLVSDIKEKERLLSVAKDHIEKVTKELDMKFEEYRD